jgi:hypothetical protein
VWCCCSSLSIRHMHCVTVVLLVYLSWHDFFSILLSWHVPCCYLLLSPFQIISRFDFFGTSILLYIYIQIHSKIDKPKKLKRLIIWNGGKIS